MKKLFTFFSILVVSISFYVFKDHDTLGQGAVYIESQSAAFAFTNVSIVPMTGKGVILKNQTVLIEDGKITLITDAKIKLSSTTKVIDGTGKYLMPGLAEMHGHVPPTHPPANAASYFNDEYVENTLFLYVAAGITTVRGMLGYDHQLELKERVYSGELIGPNLYLAGPSFNGNSISSPEEARNKVLQQKAEGWDLLKIHPGLTLAEYNAMAETANEEGITFGGHVPEEVGIGRALEAGQLTIDHLDGYVAYLNAFEGAELDSKISEIAHKTVANDVWVVPTQALWETIIGAADYDALKQYDELKYIPKAVLAGYNNFVTNLESNQYFDAEDAKGQALLRQKLLTEMNKAGVKILMGTDAPQLFSVPGFSIHRELPKMVAAGMTPYEIIESGTSNVGVYFKDKGSFGTIEVGKRADLILVNSNPLDDVSNIQQHSGVMVRGQWLSKEMIDKKLAEIKAQYN